MSPLSRSLPLALALSLSPAALAAPTFLDGVTMDGGWYDVNKRSMWAEHSVSGTSLAISDNGVSRKANTDYDSNIAYNNKSDNGYEMVTATDSSMCWAAATANTLQWWQDRKAENNGGQLPSGTPNGKAGTAQYSKLQNVAQLDIYQVLYTNFSYKQTQYSSVTVGLAGKTYIGWDYWFNGYTSSVDQLAEYYDVAAKGDTGYWSDLGYYTKLTESGNSYTNESTLFSLSIVNTNNYVTALTDPINANRAVSLTVTGAGSYTNSGHAVTMWGYEMEGDELYIYLTDSDDYYHGLVKYLVSVDGNNVTLSTADSHDEIVDENGNKVFSTLDGFRLTEVYALTADYASVPEPASATLLLLAGAALVGRRRRRA